MPAHLTVRADHGQFGVAFDRVRTVQIESEVGGRVEDVDRFDGSRTGLFVTEDQVDPVVQVVAHPTRLERLPMDQDEQSRVAQTPRRQLHIVHCITCTTQTFTLKKKKKMAPKRFKKKKAPKDSKWRRKMARQKKIQNFTERWCAELT